MNMMMEVYTLNGFLEFWEKCVESAVSFWDTGQLVRTQGELSRNSLVVA